VEEVASLEDAELESFAAVVDPTTNVLRFKPGKTLISSPQSPEELRLRHRRIGLAWDFLATKHALRVWLSPGMTDVMRRFSDFILGTQVAGLRAGESSSPSWNLVLSFEHEARKSAYKWVRDGEASTLQEAFVRSTTDMELLNRHLIIPFSLNARGNSSSWVERGAKGNGKKGTPKGGVKNTALKEIKTEGPEMKNGKRLKTDDNKPICFKYNSNKGCNTSGCKFIHVCQRCLGRHPFMKCPQVRRPGQAVDTPATGGN
jgi:hypothetical protein